MTQMRYYKDTTQCQAQGAIIIIIINILLFENMTKDEGRKRAAKSLSHQ
jgi:hypothetical protein